MGSKKRAKIRAALETGSASSARSSFQPIDRSALFLVALAVWCGALWLFQFVTLAKFSQVVGIGVKFGSFGKFLDYILNPNSPLRLDAWDGFLALLLLAIPIYLTYLQIRFKALEGAWERIGNRTWKKILSLSILFGSFCRFALHPGEFPGMFDHSFFMGASVEFRRAIQMGSFDNYSTFFYSGWNCRQYVGNLYAILAGTLEYLTGSHFGTKLLLWITGAASGVGMFLWIEVLTKKSGAAFFAATAFCLNYWHYYQVFALGHLPMGIVYGCLPWPFYFFEAGLADPRQRLRYFLLCVLPLAGITYTHFVWGAMVWGLFTIYALVRLLSRAPGAERKVLFGCFSISLVLQFLILAGLITAPLVQKKESAAYYTRGLAVNEMDITKRLRPEVLYQWYNGHWSVGEDAKAERQSSADIYCTYLGLVPLLFALLGLWVGSGRAGVDASALRIILLFLAGSLILTFFYYDLVELPGLSLFRIFLDYRYQTFVVFFMSAASAFGVLGWRQRFESRFTGYKRGLWGVLPLLLLAADVGSTTFQFPFEPSRRNAGGGDLSDVYNKESERYLEKRENVPYHFFLEGTKTSAYVGTGPGWTANAMGMPSDLGIHPESGPRQSVFGALFYDALTRRSKGPNVFPDSLATAYFYLNNFQDALFHAGQSRMIDTSRVQVLSFDGDYIYARFRHHSPVIASTTIAPYAWRDERDPLELDRLYSGMGIDYENATASRLFVQAGASPEAVSSTEKPVLTLLDYQVHSKQFLYRVRLNTPAYLRLLVSYYSFLNVRVDGREVPFYPGATYEVVLKVPAGDHVVEVEGGWDPYRKAWLYITWAAFAVLAFLATRYPGGFGARPRTGALPQDFR